MESSNEMNEAIAHRREFLQKAALMAAAGVGAALTTGPAAAHEVVSNDFTRWLDSISGNERVVLDVRDPHDGFAIGWAWVYLYTGPQAYGGTDKDLGTIMVFRHKAIPFVLDDSMWKKYKLGEYFKIEDPQTKSAATRHPYYQTPLPFDVPDMNLKYLIERGVKVVACDMALFYYSGQVAKRLGLKHDDVKQDWWEHLLPGFVHAPSGLVAIQGAVKRQAAYIFAG